MPRLSVRPSVILALSVLVACGPATQAAALPAAQTAGGKSAAPETPAAGQTIILTDQTAYQKRSEFMALLRRYPPSVSQAMKVNPALLSNQAYLAPYPALAAFLAQHPEFAGSPAFFLDDISLPSDRRAEVYDTPGAMMWRELIDGIGFLCVFGSLVTLVAWLVRSLIDYRRWSRLARVQSEAHTKLLDRFSSNDELIAYVQSPAGSQFLQSAPIALDPGARRIGAPFSRILWSVQAGIVLVMAGVGLRYISGTITDANAKDPMAALGVMGLALGIGFIVSAGVSYLLSHRLGLFEAALTPPGAPTARRDSGTHAA